MIKAGLEMACLTTQVRLRTLPDSMKTLGLPKIDATGSEKQTKALEKAAFIGPTFFYPSLWFYTWWSANFLQRRETFYSTLSAVYRIFVEFKKIFGLKNAAHSGLFCQFPSQYKGRLQLEILLFFPEIWAFCEESPKSPKNQLCIELFRIIYCELVKKRLIHSHPE